jgi:hypothetical protein
MARIFGTLLMVGIAALLVAVVIEALLSKVHGF